MKDIKDSEHTIMATRDIEDIEQAETLVLFTNGTETPIIRGAHHFEAGYAYGRGKTVITVGERDNVFYHLPCVKNFPTWQAALEAFKRERAHEEAALGY
jgi:nucleoside 2-deoxyribosyltransferase